MASGQLSQSLVIANYAIFSFTMKLKWGTFLLDLRIDTREDYNVIKVDMSIFNTTKIWTPIFEWYVEGTLQHDCGGGEGTYMTT